MTDQERLGLQMPFDLAGLCAGQPLPEVKASVVPKPIDFGNVRRASWSRDLAGKRRVGLDQGLCQDRPLGHATAGQSFAESAIDPPHPFACAETAGRFAPDACCHALEAR
jgi:hypothetical protein